MCHFTYALRSNYIPLLKKSKWIPSLAYSCKKGNSENSKKGRNSAKNENIKKQKMRFEEKTSGVMWPIFSFLGQTV